MELRQLEYFVAVAEEASFTKAAARVHVAQPGISAQIRRLERELGEPLLDRTSQGARLTEAGAAVLPYAREALAAVAGVRLAVDELAGLLRGRVSVGTLTASPGLDLPDLLAAYHRMHPAVEITLAEAGTDVLLEGLQSGRFDLAVVGLSTPPPPGIAVETLIDEALVAAVSHDDPLAGQATIGLRALEGRELISLVEGTGLRSALDQACAATGVRLRIAFEATDPKVLAQLAARGLGVATLPASLAAVHAATLHALTITRPRMRSRVELAWRTDGPASPAARALIAHARRTVAA